MIKGIFANSAKCFINGLRSILSFVRATCIRKKCAECGKCLRVNGTTNVTKRTYIGDFVNFNGMRVQGCGNVYIGNYFHSGIECLIITDVHNYEGDKIPYDAVAIPRNVVIDDCVWLGSRVTILGGVHIGEGAIIQAGSTVVCDIPACAIAGGHPARVFKYRDVEHYQKLKQAGEFF